MRRSVGLIVVAVLLAIAGGVSLIAGSFERRMGRAQEDMAVLDFEDPQYDYGTLQEDLEKLPWVSQATLDDIQLRRATLQYWQRNYTDLVSVATTAPKPEEPGKPDLMLLAANAMFRTTQRGPQDKPSMLKNLDATVKAYTETLRAGNERSDAAYNYELVVRLRQELVNGKRKSFPFEIITEDKSDSKMHGDPGEPPKDMKAEQFQIRIPIDPKEFKSSKEETAGTGQIRKRRG